MTETDAPVATRPTSDIPVLDNPVWHAIDGPSAHLAERNGLAGRYHKDVAPFGAIADDYSSEAWDDLARLIGPGHRAMLFRPTVRVPGDWLSEFRIPCVQLVADRVTAGPPDLELQPLTADDVPEMLDLVAATRPGPFEHRTIELGTYLGHRSGGRLVAMAGERMRCPGYTEVSAVCTAEDHRGKGLGAALTLAVVHLARARGEEAFLHAASDNVNAIRLYEALGFTLRTPAQVVIVRPKTGG
jgi:ribosomal protein S18 acetylase RimI-like enzyme